MRGQTVRRCARVCLYSYWIYRGLQPLISFCPTQFGARISGLFRAKDKRAVAAPRVFIGGEHHPSAFFSQLCEAVLLVIADFKGEEPVGQQSGSGTLQYGAVSIETVRSPIERKMRVVFLN